jgi:hypothetical protein
MPYVLAISGGAMLRLLHCLVGNPLALRIPEIPLTEEDIPYYDPNIGFVSSWRHEASATMLA